MERAQAEIKVNQITLKIINICFIFPTKLQTDTNQRESFASKGDPDETKITNGVTLSSKGIQKKSVAPHRPKTLALENVVSLLNLRRSEIPKQTLKIPQSKTLSLI